MANLIHRDDSLLIPPTCREYESTGLGRGGITPQPRSPIRFNCYKNKGILSQKGQFVEGRQRPRLCRLGDDSLVLQKEGCHENG